MKVEVSNGELLDKLTILELKLSNISDQEKLLNISKEHNELKDLKKSQGSINKLNETRLLNVNKALMERLIK